MADTVLETARTGGAAARRLMAVLFAGGAVSLALGIYVVEYTRTL